MSVRVHRYPDGDSAAECDICRGRVGFSDADVPGENGPVAVARFAPYLVVIHSDPRGRDMITAPLCPDCAQWVVEAGTAITAAGGA